MWSKFTFLSLLLLGATATASPTSLANEGLPTLRLNRRDVQDMKNQQKHPAGFVHGNVTFGQGNDATIVDIIEADYDILLPDDDEKGIKARSLAPRGACMSINAFINRSCVINYCWETTNGLRYSEAIAIAGSNGASNPTSCTSSNPGVLNFDTDYNDGYNGWFQRGHACSNSDTKMYTIHNVARSVFSTAWVDHLRCENCNFRNLNCESGSSLRDNLIAYANGVSSQSRC